MTLNKKHANCGCKKCDLTNQNFDVPKYPRFARKIKGFYLFDLLQIGIGIILLLVGLVLQYTILKSDLAEELFQYDWKKWTLFAIFLITILVVGYRLLWTGFNCLIRFQFNEMSLMFIAIVAAMVLGEFHEAAMVVILFKIGDILEEYAVFKTNYSIKSLINIRPDTMTLIDINNNQTVIETSLAKVKDNFIVKPGDRVPLDCVVINGFSTIDASSLTGESLPIDVSEGTKLLSGSINLSGALKCRAIATMADSTNSKMLDLISNSISTKSKTEKVITKFARIYTPIVIMSAILIATVPLAFVLSDWMTWLNAALGFLLASCPCAFVISIPLTYFCAIGVNSKLGVLIKGSKFVEILSHPEAIVFDKTGTITTGKLSIKKVFTYNGFSEKKVLDYISACEKNSNHPIASAIVDGHPTKLKITSYDELPGFGIKAKIGNEIVLCGNKKLLTKFKVAGMDDYSIIGSIVYLSIGDKLAGAVILSDTVRQETIEVMKSLKALKIDTLVMLSGDSQNIVDLIAKEVGLTVAYGELLPQDKVDCLKNIQLNNKHTLFVGDGINDGPVLVSANLGVAMGLGSDVAIDVADAVLMSGNLSALPKAIAISRISMKIVKFNIAFALTIKLAVFIIIIVGAIVWPEFNPIYLAVLADVGVTLLAVLNSARILKLSKSKNLIKRSNNIW